MANSLSIFNVTGSGVPILGNDVDTDRIVPARYLKEITFDKMGDYLFYDVRYDSNHVPREHPLNQPQFNQASIMVVEKNFGCGSSREHAPQAIKRAGFNAIIGESFAEIFSGNCKNLGVVTATLSREDLEALIEILDQRPSLKMTIDVKLAKLIIAEADIMYPLMIKKTHQNAFLEGTWDELSLLKLNDKKIQSVAKQLPYFNW